MTDLYLHIGHGKTGSSFLQSVLCRNRDTLTRHGFSFPINSDLAAYAAQGHTTSGNIDEFRAALDGNLPQAGRLLFSSEYLFIDICTPEYSARMQALLRSAKIARVHVLLFLRDPVHFALAEYHQLAKIADETPPAEVFLQDWDGISTVREVLDILSDIPGIQLTIRNYDVCKTKLLPILADWLGIPLQDFALPPRLRTNRALTVAEETLVIALAKSKLPVYSTRLAEAFSSALPDLVATPDLPPVGAQRALWDRLGPQIDCVNARLAPEDRYDIARDIRAPLPLTAADTTLSPPQLAVVAEYIALQGNMLDLAKAEADRLRTAHLPPDGG